MFMGVGLGWLVIFPVLILATGNFLMGLLSLLVIIFVSISVLGVVAVAGWDIGVSMSAILYGGPQQPLLTLLG